MRRMGMGLCAAALLLVGAPSPATAADGDPVISPRGANDFGCKPTVARPYPVILLHGTLQNSAGTWFEISPLLKRLGYCVFATDYGNLGVGPIETSATQIAAYAQRVLDATGAAKVAFVGHSQGGMVARFVAKHRNLLTRTDEIVALAPSNHGLANPLIDVLGLLVCRACADQKAGSPVIQKVNSGLEAPAPAFYTVIATRYDEIVQPYSSAFLAGPASRVTNVLLQDKCPRNASTHFSLVIPGNPVALQWVANALDRRGAANPRFIPDCNGRTLGTDPAPAPRVARSGSFRLTLRAGRLRVSRAGRVRLYVRCLGPSGAVCRSTLTLSRGGRRIGRVSRRLRAGPVRSVSIGLTRSARQAARKRYFRATLRAVTVGARPREVRRLYRISG